MAAATAAAIAGTAASLYGAANNKVKTERPSRLAAMEIGINNPNQFTPFGSSRLVTDYGVDREGKNRHDDDTYSIETNLSPEMQSLADALLSRAGASRGTFSSGGMPEGFQQEYASRLGYAPSVGSYERPEFAFDRGDGPAESIDEFQLAGATNQDALDWARKNSNIGTGAHDWLTEFFQDGYGDESDIVRGSWNSDFSGLTDANRGYVRELQNSIEGLVPESEMLDPFTPDLSGMNNEEAARFIASSNGGWDSDEKKFIDKFFADSRNSGFADDNSLVTSAWDGELPGRYKNKHEQMMLDIMSRIQPFSAQPAQVGSANFQQGMQRPGGGGFDEAAGSQVWESELVNNYDDGAYSSLLSALGAV